MNKLEEMLIRHEGLELKPYKDSVGILTIGVGRNLDKGITKDEALYLMENDIQSVLLDLHNNFSWFSQLDDARQDALTDMCFNLGINRLLGFRNMLQALSNHDYEEAAKQALDSKWAKQVGSRATELAEMIKIGEYQS